MMMMMMMMPVRNEKRKRTTTATAFTHLSVITWLLVFVVSSVNVLLGNHHFTNIHNDYNDDTDDTGNDAIIIRKHLAEKPKSGRQPRRTTTATATTTTNSTIHGTRLKQQQQEQQQQQNVTSSTTPSTNSNDTYKYTYDSHVFLADSNATADTITGIQPPYVPVSAIIPATLDRLRDVNQLLESIAAGTRLPQEIILAISLGKIQMSQHQAAATTMTTSTSLALNLSIPKGLHVRIVKSQPKQNAAQNRNRGAQQATMPVLAFVDSDDVVGKDWIETVFHVFHHEPTIDALLHKWFFCHNKKPRNDLNHTWSLSEPENLIIANELMPSNLSQQEATKWVAHPQKVGTPGNHHHQQQQRQQLLLWDSEFNHPWWTLGHVAVKRNVYLTVKQNENAVGHEDALFTADMLLQGYKVATIKNQLTGYCKQ